MELADADLLLTILEMRSYTRAKEQVDAAKKPGDLKMTPAITRVFEVEILAMKAGR